MLVTPHLQHNCRLHALRNRHPCCSTAAWAGSLRHSAPAARRRIGAAAARKKQPLPDLVKREEDGDGSILFVFGDEGASSSAPQQPQPDAAQPQGKAGARPATPKSAAKAAAPTAAPDGAKAKSRPATPKSASKAGASGTAAARPPTPKAAAKAASSPTRKTNADASPAEARPASPDTAAGAAPSPAASASATPSGSASTGAESAATPAGQQPRQRRPRTPAKGSAKANAPAGAADSATSGAAPQGRADKLQGLDKAAAAPVAGDKQGRKSTRETSDSLEDLFAFDLPADIRQLPLSVEQLFDLKVKHLRMLCRHYGIRGHSYQDKEGLVSLIANKANITA